MKVTYRNSYSLYTLMRAEYCEEPSAPPVSSSICEIFVIILAKIILQRPRLHCKSLQAACKFFDSSQASMIIYTETTKYNFYVTTFRKDSSSLSYSHHKTHAPQTPLSIWRTRNKIMTSHTILPRSGTYSLPYLRLPIKPAAP